MTDDEQLRVEAIADQLRGLGMTEEQIERHVSYTDKGEALSHESSRASNDPRTREACHTSPLGTDVRIISA